ncbi:R3H domain-containing nucleic acid-binding protein [Chamaesiphon sp. GL140_3_metabinner_50]|uniref:Jag family protein n=1 Tax=Chamaesiphon sp. GL140_3_metabinner_50 TaxID=2970812 RepID=UPI0025D4ED65|nr:R3H domain-containing nucleic acid-binding protein [Chamaesiphon sp. GL140_3_metabinner_50]
MTDQRLDRAKQWLEQLLSLSGIATTVDTVQPAGASETNYWLTIDPNPLTPAQKELLIGSEGAAIDAIQYLANASLNIHAEADLQAGYTIELDGYRQRRAIALKTIADEAAERVRATGTEVILQPMSSAERRQMHTFFDSDPSYSDLATQSRGQEPDRRLVVQLAQPPAVE